MSDTKWPRFEARQYPTASSRWFTESKLLWYVTARWRINESNVRVVADDLTEPEARAMAAALNLAREARELAEAVDDETSPGGRFERGLTDDMRGKVVAYRAAKAKETQ